MERKVVPFFYVTAYIADTASELTAMNAGMYIRTRVQAVRDGGGVDQVAVTQTTHDERVQLVHSRPASSRLRRRVRVLLVHQQRTSTAATPTAAGQ